MTFPAAVAAEFPERPEVLPLPARTGRIWRIVASAAYTAFTGGDSSAHGIFTAGFALAHALSFAGRSSALHLGFGLAGYALTSHDLTAEFYDGCGSGYDSRYLIESREVFGSLARFIFATRFIESSLGMGALYGVGRHPGCPGEWTIKTDFWALAVSASVAVAVDPGNTVLLRGEFLGYMANDPVRSLSLGLEVHL